jgi:hypothetical protein
MLSSAESSKWILDTKHQRIENQKYHILSPCRKCQGRTIFHKSYRFAQTQKVSIHYRFILHTRTHLRPHALNLESAFSQEVLRNRSLQKIELWLLSSRFYLAPGCIPGNRCTTTGSIASFHLAGVGPGIGGPLCGKRLQNEEMDVGNGHGKFGSG